MREPPTAPAGCGRSTNWADGPVTGFLSRTSSCPGVVVHRLFRVVELDVDGSVGVLGLVLGLGAGFGGGPGGRSGWGRRPAGVGVAGGGGDGDLAGPVGVGLVAPAVGFLDLVAGRAQALTVGQGGGAAGGAAGDVVDVPDRGVAPGGAAGLVAGGDEGAGGVGELAAFAVAVGEVAGGRVGVQAADPGAGAGVGVGDQAAGQRGGDGAVADQVGGFGVAVEQGAVGHHQLDVQVDAGRQGVSAGSRSAAVPVPVGSVGSVG